MMQEKTKARPQKKKRQKWLSYLKGNYDLYLFLLPAAVTIFLFSYLPIYGILLAFKDYSVSKGILGSPRAGIVNKLLESFGQEEINFMANAAYFPHIYVWTGVWQSAGWNSVIYFAALSGISPELHEAAMIDGASKWRRILHIDLPGILPTAVVLLILNMGNLMSVGYEKVYLLQNNTNIATSEVIATYVYKMGIVNNDISFSTAVGLFNSVVNLILLVTVNWISGKVSENSLW